MKYLLFISIALFFSQCSDSNNKVPCYFVVTVNDPLTTCSSNPNHNVELDWGLGAHVMTNVSSYTTTQFMDIPGLGTQRSMIIKHTNICNNFKVDFYADAVLVGSQTAQIGYQNDCIVLCGNNGLSTSKAFTFSVP